MSKPMKVKAKYFQGHLYIIIFGIYRRCPAAIPIFDILIGFGVMAERLNPYIGIFRFFLVFFDPPDPHRQKFKIRVSTKSNDKDFGCFVRIWLKSVGQILRIFAEKKDKQLHFRRIAALARDPKNSCILEGSQRSRAILTN